MICEQLIARIEKCFPGLIDIEVLGVLSPIRPIDNDGERKIKEYQGARNRQGILEVRSKKSITALMHLRR